MGTHPEHGGKFCPVCNVPEFALSQFRSIGVKENQLFRCKICGATLRYTVVKRFLGEDMFLHIVSGVLTADGKIR